MILPYLYIAPAGNMGRGVFTAKKIAALTIIEIAPVIVMGAADRILLDQTALYNYIFEWGEKEDQCCVALGYLSIYNHSYQANCDYEMDYGQEIITVKTIQNIEPGQELFINYNGAWNNDKKVWFHKENTGQCPVFAFDRNQGEYLRENATP